MTRRAVFLDRDGVINRARVVEGRPYPPRALSELEILPGVAEALQELRDAGFLLIVATNQPDVARGTTLREEVDAINRRLMEQLALDDIRVCIHDSADGCECRKPKPGLLADAAKDHAIDLARSYMVGDRWRDIEAGRRVGCTTLFIDYCYAEKRPEHYDYSVESLREACRIIINQKQSETGIEMKAIEQLKIKIFADGADKAGMLEMYRKPFVKGLTTNPTLMRKAGITDYRAFAKDILREIPDRPISFEVFSDDFVEMERQAREIASWGPHVYVKIPITNTQRRPCYELASRLTRDGVKVNVTALMTTAQVKEIANVLNPGVPAYVSVFAGRIADTGRDPVPLMSESVQILRKVPAAELIWASPRELLNIFQADSIGCHVITVTNDILKKLSLVGYGLDEYSLDTVKMFHEDARKAAYKL
jgi:transaldolase